MHACGFSFSSDRITLFIGPPTLARWRENDLSARATFCVGGDIYIYISTDHLSLCFCVGLFSSLSSDKSCFLQKKKHLCAPLFHSRECVPAACVQLMLPLLVSVLLHFLFTKTFIGSRMYIKSQN